VEARGVQRVRTRQLFFHQDEKRVEVPLGRAPHRPGADRRIGAEHRDGLAADRQPDPGRLEERLGGPFPVVEEGLERLRIAEHPFQQLRRRTEAAVAQQRLDALPDVLPVVAPEVIAVAPPDPFEQQLDLEILDAFRHRPVHLRHRQSGNYLSW
jgi:hypothetical protein